MTDARAFSSRLADLLRNERIAFADFLLALAEFDRLGLWRDLGYASLFYFLHRELGLSKGAAHYRKVAAELVRRYPEIIEPLRDGRLCITSVVELAKVITPENRAEVVPRFFHCSKREAKEVSAELDPVEAVPRREVVTALAGSNPSRAAVAVAPLRLAAQARVHPGEPVHPDEPPPTPDRATVPAVPSNPISRRDPPPATAEPLTPDLRRLHITVSRQLLEKLDAARDALSHSHPCATTEDILEAGLDLILAQHAKRKGIVARPLATPRPTATDDIPAHVKRAVWIRDRGCCQWPLAGGGVCGSRKQVEFDHIRPKALGGESTEENIRLLCRVHNDLAARRAFGDRWMDQFTRMKRSAAANDAPAAGVEQEPLISCGSSSPPRSTS